ncbi:MAG: CBS domain-containing protein [Bryobacteraceae bacterium]|jgi:CBS domain-containing protein|nr:CBS domain-containing protein [Bryobacteraceae bacterium]
MKPGASLAELLGHKGGAVYSIAPDATVYDAIHAMADRSVGALLVMRDDALLGIISERDYTRKVILAGRSSRETRVEEIMTSNLVTASSSQTVEEAMKLMTEARVRHLPVLEGGRVAGVVSIGDLVKWIISAQEDVIAQLSSYIHGSYPA